MKTNGSRNQLRAEDAPVHDWYRFVLSYPPHLVAEYLERFGVEPGEWVLDPFCGTGTTLVECRKRGFSSIGTDAHPIPIFASRVKTKWDLPVQELRDLLGRIVRSADEFLAGRGLPRLSLDSYLVSDGIVLYESSELQLSEEERQILPTGFISPNPLTRLLALRKCIERHTVSALTEIRHFFLLGLAHAAVNGAANIAFGPEIYRTKAKEDYDVTGHFARQVSGMIDDLDNIQKERAEYPPCAVIHDDARTLAHVEDGISAVITSPPYPNEKDYTRTTRVESILLGLIRSKQDLRAVKETLLRSNTRNVFVKDDDGKLVEDIGSIQKICSAIEARRMELAKDSGFERLYHKVVAHYFGGMRRHFRSLFPKLRRGAKCAYVVGDQLSFLMIPIPTATLLAEIAEQEGYKVIGCDLWRERVGTKVRTSRTPLSSVRVQENVLLLGKT